jgi:uncharacterized protein with ParB-like and HNH nuclease domain
MENIKQIIEERIKELKITSLDISFNELADMYNDSELIIQPEYQRTFRWDAGKQSRFIESLLMEMPVPPIYVIELDDGKYELIDGLQRISSYLSYRGLLKLEEAIEDDSSSIDDFTDYQDDGLEDEPNVASLAKGFELDGCDIIKELNGLRYSELQASMQIKLKRAYVRLEVLRKGINPEMKYHMFKRLNTGGEKLSPQEIRNCTIRLIDDKFINYIKELKADQYFRSTIARIGTTKIKKRFDEELVLRYFAFKNSYSTFKHNVDDFLTQYMEKIALNTAMNGVPEIFNYEQERERFRLTFKFLSEACGNAVFCTVNAKKDSKESVGVFNAYLFEAITVGIQESIGIIARDQSKYEVFSKALQDLKKDKDFRDATIGGGKNSPTPMNIRRQKVQELMKGLCA